MYVQAHTNTNTYAHTVYSECAICQHLTFLSLSLSAAMGVLMSKKQQVEKVQKCTAVVSAFQAGVKDRQAAAKRVEEEVTEEVGTSQEKKSEEERKEKEKGEQVEEGAEEKEEDGEEGSTGPSTSQQGAAASRDECKVNQEAWSRLRDGKGVEPEDLDKSHQLTPPAFIRPKREADDDQPLEVELNAREQVTHGSAVAGGTGVAHRGIGGVGGAHRRLKMEL